MIRVKKIRMKFIKHPLFKNTIVYTVTDCINKAIPFIALPVLTRFMSPSDYGMVANYLVLLAVLSAFIGLNANSAVAINFFKLEDRKSVV